MCSYAFYMLFTHLYIVCRVLYAVMCSESHVCCVLRDVVVACCFNLWLWGFFQVGDLLKHSDFALIDIYSWIRMVGGMWSNFWLCLLQVSQVNQ